MVRKQNGGRRNRRNRKTRRISNVPLLPLERVAKGQYLQRQNAQRHLINYNRAPTINIPQEQRNSPKKRGWGTFLFGSLDSPTNNSRVSHNNVRNGTRSAFPLTNSFNNTRRNNKPLHAPPPLLPHRNNTRRTNKPLYAPPPPPRRNNTKRNRIIMVPRNQPVYPYPPRPYHAPPPPSYNKYQTGLEYLKNLNKPKKPDPPLYAINNTRKKTRYPPRGYAPRMTRNNRPALNWEHYYPQGTNPNTYVNTE
jgi:hypothetical protein